MGRGPDGEGANRVGDSWLGHRRLAIVDVDGGDQPIFAAQGGAAMVGNGEIYNHDTLRSRLAGATYTTRSDNEVALQLFLAEGVAGLGAVSYTHLRAHETDSYLVCR